MKSLTVVLSGKKSSGKSTLARLILKEYLNKKIGQNRFVVEKSGKQTILVDTYNNKVIPTESPNELMQSLTDTYGVKVYSFTDYLKGLCINVFGLDKDQCYGSESDKGTNTHILWENVFDELREKYKKPRRGSGGIKPACGPMTAKELVTLIDQDIFKRLDRNYSIRAFYNMIEKEKVNLAIAHDASTAGEISIASELGAKTIKLTKVSKYKKDLKDEDELDLLPLGEYSLVIDNMNNSIEKTNKIIKSKVSEWMEENNG